MSTITVISADLANPSHADAVLRIVDSYAQCAAGHNAPLPKAVRENLIDGLRRHPTTEILLACDGPEPIGVAVCFWGFSTFAARPLLNIHDLAVLPEHRGRGAGRAMLDEARRRVAARGGCKVTLEVHDSNDGAKRLYEREGFGPWSPATWSVSRDVAPSG